MIYRWFCRFFQREVCVRCGVPWCGGPVRVRGHGGKAMVLKLVPWKLCTDSECPKRKRK